ncbi:MAG: restriction endonuclease subunit S [Candidatus Tectomicrobia bacterium]|nr:restriction endonuclease subunit S [Candidatus Tectomicrobia bacterium]
MQSTRYGFKETELGSIPEEWEVKPLRSLTIKTEMANPTAKPEESFEYIDVSSVSNELFRIIGSTTIKGVEAPSRARKEVHTSDVLFATVRPTLKRVALVPSHLHGQVASTAFCVVRANRTVADPAFLYYSLLTADFIAKLAELERGVSYPAVTDNNVFDQRIAVPPLYDQRAIAWVLGRIQVAVEAQEKIIATLRQLKQAVMAKLFREGLRHHSDRVEHPIFGFVPNSWTTCTLGILCGQGEGTIQTGPFGSQLHASDYKESGIPVVNPTHIADNRIIHKDLPRISKKDYQRLSRHILRQGDILFARRGEIGRHALVTEQENEWLCGTGCFLVRIQNPDVDNAFLSLFLYYKPCQLWLESHAAGSIMPNLNTTILNAIPIVLPTIDEQHEIAHILRTIDDKLTNAEKKRDALQALFKTMLHQLMTGQIRVSHLEVGNNDQLR